MNPAWPISVECEVRQRRFNGSPVPDIILRGAANTITYDIVSATAKHGFEREGMVPYKRIVASGGLQVEIEAAQERDICWVKIFSPTDIRLYLNESIVWDDCINGA